MRALLIVIASLTVSLNATAADVIECNEVGTQTEMNVCAADDFAKADKELNEVYSALLEERAKDQLFVAKMRAAQRAWIAFRDAELEAIFACEDSNPRYCWGSMYPMSYLSAKAELTRERTEALHKHLQEARDH